MTYKGARIKQFPDLTVFCGWRIVKFMPPGSTEWYGGNDRLSGEYVEGDPSDNTKRWSI